MSHTPLTVLLIATRLKLFSSLRLPCSGCQSGNSNDDVIRFSSSWRRWHTEQRPRRVSSGLSKQWLGQVTCQELGQSNPSNRMGQFTRFKRNFINTIFFIATVSKLPGYTVRRVCTVLYTRAWDKHSVSGIDLFQPRHETAFWWRHKGPVTSQLTDPIRSSDNDSTGFWPPGSLHYPTLAREFQGFRVWGKFVFRTLELTDTPTNLANQVKVGHALDQSRSVQSRGPESAPKQCAVMAIVEDRSPTFETVLRELSGCICILSVG